MAAVFSTKLTLPAPSHLSTSRRPNSHPKLPSFYHFSPSNPCSFRKSPISASPPSSGCSPISCSSSTATSSSPFRYFEIDEGSLWEGALVYRREPSVTCLEYCTTLESLGLEKLSSDLSKPTRASSIGIRVTKAVKEFPLGTAVQISMDVYRKKKRLKLEGIIKTVITLACNKAGDFSDFQLLLLQDPTEASDNVFVGSFYGDQVKRRSSEGVEEEDDDEVMVNFDDQLYFPVEEKVIDISKPIRDTTHVEIAINDVCDPICKGGCLQCGVNLSRGPCRCGTKRGVFRSVAVTGNQVS